MPKLYFCNFLRCVVERWEPVFQERQPKHAQANLGDTHFGSSTSSIGGCGSEDPYYFTLEPADYTAPTLLVMDVSVTATGVDVRVQIDEDGSVVCAALSDVTGACTADIELLQVR